jgi:hypothetical protein
MLEQNINKSVEIVAMEFLHKTRVFVAAFLILSLGACVPAGEKHVNTELFKNKEELRSKTSSLKPGISKKEAFEVLKVAPEKFERMSLQDVQYSVYGNSVVQGTPEQLEQFKQKLLAYEGYSLPYRNLKSSSSLGFGKMKVHTSGADMRLVLIFEKGKLLRAAVEGTENVNQNDDQSLWGSLIRKGIGIAF